LGNLQYKEREMNKMAFIVTIFTLLSLFPNAALAITPLQVNLKSDAVVVETKLNINNADVEQLTQIKGLGKKKAEAIVNYINENGKLTSLDQLVNVKGIGNKLVQKLSPYLIVE
jgi:competence protein ComEA